MSSYEVPEPIISLPFEEPREHWNIIEGEIPERVAGRRKAVYFYRDPKAAPGKRAGEGVGTVIELKLVNLIRERVAEWRRANYPGVTRTTLELLSWWSRDGREQRRFFAQMEAAETIIFLNEARTDFRQGIAIPRDEPGDEKKSEGTTGFTRYACKMATGSGKTTVMGMIAAWSILNKVNDRGDARFSDVVLVVCPNVTIRVDSKVVHETDTGQARSDESRWMRFTLDTVGRIAWPADRQGCAIYPKDFEELAKKLGRPLHPPGRDVRCIVSVGMLTEGWDCSTVTHIIGLRPFMSQLLCEQVVGRGLRRTAYEAGEDGRFTEEVAKVFGVPFEVIPFKSNKQPAPAPMVKRRHVHAVPVKAEFEILYPRVEGYTQKIQNRIAINWANVPPLFLEPGRIPPEVEVKALSVSNEGKLSLFGPGRLDEVTLSEFRARRRMQELVFDLARGLARHYIAQGHCDIPAHALFPQLTRIIAQYVEKKVHVQYPAHKKDLFLAPYYGWLVERLVEAIGPDTSQGEAPEVPIYESSRGPGSTSEVDFWTSREVREVLHSHVNYVVADTRRWEQSAAYYVDKHPDVAAFAKNAGLGFAIPYLHNGQMHDYLPDFLVKLKTDVQVHLILETKGFDPLADVKRAAAERWVAAVNAEGHFGSWHYQVTRKIEDIPRIITEAAGRGSRG